MHLQRRKLTSNPLAVIMAQEHDNLGNVVGHGASAEGDELGNASLDLLNRGLLGGARRVVPCVLGEHVGFDTTRRDGIASDSSWSAIGGEGSCQTFSGRLGCAVQGMVRHTQTGSDGRHEDDTTAICRGNNLLAKEIADLVPGKDLDSPLKCLRARDPTKN